jgi:drug/metabolite transporter (DMT)-like permease
MRKLVDNGGVTDSEKENKISVYMSETNSPTKEASTLAIWMALVSVWIVWGSTYLAIRFAVETIPPFLMAGSRFLIAGGVLYLWRRLAGDTPPARFEWRSAAIVGWLLLLGANGGVSWAEQYVMSGVAALLVALAPMWMVLIDAIIPGGRKPNRWAILGVVIGFSGVALLVGPAQLTGLHGDVDPIGAGVLVMASFLWASGSIYNRGAQLPKSPLLGTGMQMLAGGTGLILLGTFCGEWGRLDITSITMQSLWGLVYLIVFGSWVGFVAYIWVLRAAPTPLVATYAYVNPLVAITVGNLLGSEPITTRLLLAAAIIVSSVAIITITQPIRRKRNKIVAPATRP